MVTFRIFTKRYHYFPNREMQLDDGRFLMAADRYDSLLKVFSIDFIYSKKAMFQIQFSINFISAVF